MDIPLTFEFPHLSSIVIVGLGGTGGHVSRSVARMIYDLRRRGGSPPRLILIDPDIVEEKNCGRQQFGLGDVGENKAICLARAYNRALGLDIAAIPEPFESGRFELGRGILLVGCVDNAAARQALAASRVTWLDTGNAYDSGQVVLGTTDDPLELAHYLERHSPENKTVSILPNAALVYPALLEPDPVETKLISCAELMELGEQSILINEQVAVAAARYIKAALYREPLNTFMTHIDGKFGNQHSIPITLGMLCHCALQDR